jgi:LPXTG-motif cell wall-anchored protein
VPDTYSSPTLDAAFIVDNLGVITLNGTGISPGQIAEHWDTNGPIDVASMVHAGWNELQVTLVDQGGLAGINFRLVISLQSDEEVIVAPPGSEPIQVSYDANGGSVSKLSDLYNIGDPGFNLPTPQRLGWIFLGWFTDPLEGQQVWETNYVPASTSTLHAHWAAPESAPVDLANTGGDVTWPLVAGLSCISVGLVLALRRRQN